MNFSTAIFLINKTARAVSVSYEVGADGKGKAPFYVFKTLDPEVTVGDHVVIPTDTRHNMTVGRVEAVDLEIDFDSDVQLKWILSRVDTARAAEVERQEAEAIRRIRSAEARSKRDELAAKLMADNPDLSSLSIATDAAPVLSPPPLS